MLCQPAIESAYGAGGDKLQPYEIARLLAPGADGLGDARRAGAWVYGADGGARVGHAAVDYRGAGVVLVLGSEGRGLRPRVAAMCDELVALPLRGRIGSLNVSAAAAALLYEIVRQRDAP